LGAAIVAALFMAGCAQKSPTIARVEGSEPQRLSFGNPQAVQKAFTDKMKLCWFNGPGAPLAGYRFEATAAVLDSGDGQAPMEQIVIRDGGGGAAVFVVQFNAFNENTLISTRSQGFPPQVAARMKLDVETWVLERDGCAGDENVDLKNAGAPANAQAARSSGWW
jgi:hypothetical protein